MLEFCLLIFYIFVAFLMKKIQISNYEKELEEMKHMTRQEYVASLRRYIKNYTSLCYNTMFVR